MMELASRPYISAAPLSTHAALANSHNVLVASSLPLPRPLYPPPQSSPSSYSRRSSDSIPFIQGAHNRTIPPLTHVRDNVYGHRSPPPPPMTTADPAPTCSYNVGSYNGASSLTPRYGHRSSEEGLGGAENEQYQHPAIARSPPRSRDSTYSQASSELPLKKRRSSTARGAAMVVPSSINDTKQSLPDFAAQVTCLFWFESTTLLNSVAEATIPPAPCQPLERPSIPPPQFLKWVSTVLSTTQVSQNVVLLALLFIHRLKKLNPSVQGMPGSQYRLFTVALMLGNKYLDDNTYTNKTWAEVSGISVQEIHIMEVEFLSNMRYSLYVADNEWTDWHKKLGRFWAYWDAASKLPPHPPLPKCTIPKGATIPAPLPSPPYSNGSSPPYTTSRTPPTPTLQSLPLIPQLLPLPSLAVDPPYHPATPMPQPDFFSRKRSLDYNAMQPPNKRVAKSQVPKLSVSVPQFSPSVPAPGNSNYRFAPEIPPPPPAPRSPIDSLLQYHTQPQQQQPQYQPQYQAPLALPPSRSAPVSYSPMTSTPASAGPSQQGFPPFHWSPYTARPTSPYSAHHSVVSSPITPGHVTQYSPTSILGDRQSPYRPVRGVNTLLVPPHPHHLEAPQQLSYSQMHYQPLAKAREYKTGVVPYTQPEVGWQYLGNMLP